MDVICVMAALHIAVCTVSICACYMYYSGLMQVLIGWIGCIAVLSMCDYEEACLLGHNMV
jgi:hypothetical protein